MLRLLLGRYLEAAPEQLEFSYGPHGKPALAGLYGRSGLRFNLSHSNWLALCAVARQREVGVDVEYMERPVHHEQIARRFFSPEEVEALKRLPPEKRKEGFFNAWTRKEAYLKALGQGITAGLDSFSVSLGPGQEAALLKSSEGTAEVGRWQLQALSPAPGYAAALCAEGRDWRLRCFHWKG
jgi:4'-phosphopantetheinyl transferase